MALILDNLYLSGCDTARDPKWIKNHKIKYVLIAAKGLKQHFTFVEYKQLDIADNPTAMIIKHFLDCIQFIEERRPKGAILIHCMGGVSRSVTITIAYIMFQLKMPYEDAYKYVKQRRIQAEPNPGFVHQLKCFEKALIKYAEFQKNDLNLLKQIMNEIDTIGFAQAYGDKMIQQD